MESTDSSTGPPPQPQPQQQLQPVQPHLPPGFRFHPTDEELVVHYLKRKAASVPLPVSIIAEVDLYKFDPWELPGKASFGEQEWYFFSPRDRKYPNGARPNRAATSGYWKATGTDKPIMSSIGDSGGCLAPAGQMKKVGVKKALVFYGGKPPKGIKTNWIMHEYRLVDGSGSAAVGSRPPQHHHHGNGKKASLRLDDWVLCRIYKKNNSGSGGGMNNSMSNNTQRLLIHDSNSMDHSIRQMQEQQQSTSNYTALLENDETFFEGFLTNNNSSNNTTNHTNNQNNDTIIHSSSTNSITAAAFQTKRALQSPYWCIDDAAPGKRVFQTYSNNNSNNNSGNNSSSNYNNNDNNEGANTIETLLGQSHIPADNYSNVHSSLFIGNTAVFRQPGSQPGMKYWNS